MENLIGAPTDNLHAFIELALLLFPAFLVCVLAPVLLFRRAASSKRRLCLPPGPPALPFIGHLHLLGTHPHHTLRDLSRAHGPLMLLRFGSVPALIASTPAMAREILQTHDRTFSWRPQPGVPLQLHNCEDIAFSQPGEYWKAMRRICATDLFGSKRLQSFEPVIGEEVRELLRSILNNPINVAMRASLYTATSHIISRMVLGKRLPDLKLLSQADPSCNLVNLLVEVISLVGIFNVADYFPSLAWLDLQGCIRKTKAIAHKIHQSLQEVIDQRRQLRRQESNSTSTAYEDNDFLDVLISASEGGQSFPIKDSNVRAVLLDMYGAGIDTSSVSTEWALCELLANPTKMRKLQEELKLVVGMSRLVQQADIPQLPYLHAVVKETMRLHPVAPLLIPRKASQECKVGGYDVPAGALTYVNVWAIGRDPDVWDRSLEFKPERFLDCDMDVRGQHFELIPFGSGRRACPGMSLGLLNVHFMLASIAHCFDWSATDELNLSEKFGIILTPETPLVATGTLKLPRHLLEMQAC